VPYPLVLQSTSVARKFGAALVIVIAVALQTDSRAQSHPHMRVLDPALKAHLERGVAQSPTLRDLVEEVEATPMLVFAECSLRLPTGISGRMNFVTSVNGVRFIRIAIDCMLTDKWQIMVLAHEIQHALEIGRRPDVEDVEAMELLFEEIGFPTARDRAHRHFETEAAQVVQRAVEHELDGKVTGGAAAD
jgi:hypothetical protein